MRDRGRGICLALAFVVTACVPNVVSTPSSSVLTASPDVAGASGSSTARAFSLLANNHLLVADPSSGIVIAELTLAGPAAVAGQRRALALSPDGGSLFALVSEADARALLAVVDTTGLKLSASFDLDRKLSYRGIAIGPRTGHVYLFANQDGDALIQVLDPRDGGITEWLARRSDGRNWFVYQGGVTADESALFLSYHGDTTGIDRFEIQANGLARWHSRFARFRVLSHARLIRALRERTLCGHRAAICDGARCGDGRKAA